MKVYIVVVIVDDLNGSEEIDKVFTTKELAEKYIKKQEESYLYRIIDEIVNNEF